LPGGLLKKIRVRSLLKLSISINKKTLCKQSAYHQDCTRLFTQGFICLKYTQDTILSEPDVTDRKVQSGLCQKHLNTNSHFHIQLQLNLKEKIQVI